MRPAFRRSAFRVTRRPETGRRRGPRQEVNWSARARRQVRALIPPRTGVNAAQQSDDVGLCEGSAAKPGCGGQGTLSLAVNFMLVHLDWRFAAKLPARNEWEGSETKTVSIAVAFISVPLRSSVAPLASANESTKPYRNHPESAPAFRPSSVNSSNWRSKPSFCFCTCWICALRSSTKITPACAPLIGSTVTAPCLAISS